MNEYRCVKNDAMPALRQMEMVSESTDKERER